MMRLFLLAAGAAILGVTGGAIAKRPPADMVTAVAAPGRPADQVALDAARRPVEMLTFAGLRRGMRAADIMAGGGYYTEIIARAVGPKGHVTAYEPAQFMPTDDKGKAVWSSLIARNPNVTQVAYPFERFTAPANSVDFTMLHLSYHDLYWQSAAYKVPRTDPAAFVAALFRATRPGGIVAVIDHVGAPGDTRAIVDKVHRIDPGVVKADFLRAGFVLEAESDLLTMPGDDHSKMVFDPAVQGKTDRFAFRFRKPKNR